MLDAGHAVTVALPHEGPLAGELRAAGAGVVTMPMFVTRKRLLKPRGWPELLSTSWRGFLAARRTLRSEHPAAVFVNTITLPQWPLLARVFRIPVILHVHEGEAAAGGLVKRVLYFGALFARRILINSRFSLDVMTSVYPRLRSRTEIVPNAVPSPAAPPPARDALTGGLRVLYVGRLSPRKGVDVAVAAVADLRRRGHEATLDVVGSVFEGYEWYEEELRDAAAAAPEGTVRFHGFQSDIWRFLADADVLVVPSRLDEPFGNTAVEGVLAGRAVVVSDTSGLIEATEGIPTAFRVRPDSADEIAGRLELIEADWSEIRRELPASKELAHERHDPARYRTRIARAVDAVAQPAPHGT